MIRYRRPVAARARLAAFTVVAAVAGALVGLAGPAAAGEPHDLLPDLRLAVPGSFHVCGAPTGGTFQTENCPDPAPGNRWLRFDSILMNVGTGTFRLIASRASTADESMHSLQRIRQSDGTWRNVASEAMVHWGLEEDGHPHWHTQDVERYRLFRLPTPFATGEKVGVKRGYCFFDGLHVRPDLANARPSPLYRFDSCSGTIGNGVPAEDELRLLIGLSVGWGDEYPWKFAGQRIPINKARDGEYLLCLTADPLGQFIERREGNNESWAHIALTTVGTGSDYHVDVTVLERGTSRCQTQVPYPIPELPAP